MINSLNSFPLPQQQLEGANCADLPPEVVDRYFWASAAAGQKFFRDTAKRICGRCVILDECRLSALNMPNSALPTTIGGESRNGITVAKSWLLYELGYRETPPLDPRPDWLARSEAAETTEQALTEEEVGVEL